MNLVTDSSMLPLVTGRNATDCSVSSLAGANLQCSSVQGRGIKQPQLILCKAVTPRARLSRNERHSTACPSLCIFLLLRKQVLGTQISSFKQAMQSKGQRCPCDTNKSLLVAVLRVDGLQLPIGGGRRAVSPTSAGIRSMRAS